MFLQKKMSKSTENYWEKIRQISDYISQADGIVIGAGAGLSAAAGLTYSGQRFEKLFADYRRKYGLTDMYSGAFYPYDTLEEFWAYMSRHIYYNRYEQDINATYKDLFYLVKDKNYFIITTNVDHLFQKTGFDKDRLFYTQGDYGLFQCSGPCHNKTYDNKEMIYEMVKGQREFKISTDLIPSCPRCGKPMTTNLRKDGTFVEDEGWHKGLERYQNFIQQNKNKKIVFLELGVGFNTPAIIKYPFWQMTNLNEKATFICINEKEAVCPKEIEHHSILLEEDIAVVLAKLLEYKLL